MIIFKKSTFKILGRILLGIGVFASIIILPRLIPVILVKMIDTIFTDPIYDEDGKIIYQDGRKTIKSFGKRKQFAVEKGFRIEDDGKKIRTWELFDIDKNNCIDEIRYFTRSSSSPCVYSLGKKGYTKLNYETGEIIQSRNINDFQGDDKTVFEKLEIVKSEAENDQEKYEFSWKWIFS